MNNMHKSCIYIRVFGNATKVEIKICQYILVVDIVHRSLKAMVDGSRCDIKMSTFALKF